MEKTEEDLLFTSPVLLVFIYLKNTNQQKVILLQIFGGRANAQTRLRTRSNPGEGTRVGVGSGPQSQSATITSRSRNTPPREMPRRSGLPRVRGSRTKKQGRTLTLTLTLTLQPDKCRVPAKADALRQARQEEQFPAQRRDDIGTLRRLPSALRPPPECLHRGLNVCAFEFERLHGHQKFGVG